MVNQIDNQIVQLFDAFVKSPNGLDIHQIGDILNLDTFESNGSGRKRAFKVIRQLRLRLGTFNGDPNDDLHGYTVPIKKINNKSVYFLTANREQGSEWQGIRADTVLSRLEVDLAHWQSMVSSTDGRTTNGKIARLYVKHFSRLIEDVQEIAAGGF